MLAARQVVVIVLFATAASLVFLAILGPAPPTTLDVFYQPAPPKPRFILGDREYATFDDAANTRWDAVLPSTGGSVIATNMTSGFHFWAQLSMFHQLRCLRDIRAQLLRMSRSPAEAADFMAQHGLDSHYAQLGYCFDYILQGVLCHADTTMNPVARLNDQDQIIDGNALWHQCRDSSALMQWADVSGFPHRDSLIRENPHA